MGVGTMLSKEVLEHERIPPPRRDGSRFSKIQHTSRSNVLIDAHGDDPEFGYGLLTVELERAGHLAGERRIWRLCFQQRLRSTTVRKGSARRRQDA
jgi:hypothetical protein